MSEVKKIVGINLLVLILYTVLIHFSITGNEKSMGILSVSATAICFQVFINLFVSIVNFINKNKPLGRAYLLSAGLTLVVGFSTCLGNASF